ncbi:formylglycine-generating enzyme family protein [Pendulispora albinea]|uniref:Formylglycine-generating enzyme family protein n=1 Tax=Pendulispora albinea TaxID=2741071 RepID=A0ABZ2LNW3_9BACT
MSHHRRRGWARFGAAAVAGVAGVSLTYVASCYDFTFTPAGPSRDGSIDTSSPAPDADDGREKPLACPTGAGTRGPAMVGVRAPRDAGVFCIDSTEVTRAQYAEFLAAKVDPGKQIGVCEWNTTFEPDSKKVAPQPGNHPVVAVDWCDAYAYCAWAGKTLCGDLDGGPHTAFTEPASVVSDRWRIACTRGEDGFHIYPYGNTYDASVCNAYERKLDATVPVGSDPGCVGGFPGIFDMSANVGEWENTCEISGDGSTPTSDRCALRGGSFHHDEDEVRCNDLLIGSRTLTFPDVGFRCCNK